LSAFEDDEFVNTFLQSLGYRVNHQPLRGPGIDAGATKLFGVDFDTR
jgi:hypothetical protein